MATTTLGTNPTPMTDRRSLYWGIAIAVVLAIAVILSVRATSMRDTLVAPAATVDTTPVERTTAEPINAQPMTNPATEQTQPAADSLNPNGPAGPGPQRNDPSRPTTEASP